MGPQAHFGNRSKCGVTRIAKACSLPTRPVNIPLVNIWSEEWDEDQPEGRRRRVLGGETLGATLYELSRGGGIAYHFHHGTEELLVVLRGRLTLRTPDGTRDVGTGELVHFPVGPAGTHAITNDCDEPVRYLMISTLRSPNVTEYPDTRQLAVTAATKNQFGEELHETWNLDEPYAG